MHNLYFIDIETVPEVPEYSQLSPDFQALWDIKAGYLARNGETPDALYERAGIYAEFGKIICISVGYVVDEEVRIKSFYGDDEKTLLHDFIKLLNHPSSRDKLLCAHNGKEFDFPYLARRILINGLNLPTQLDVSGKKPWEIPHLDTLEMWKFGDYKHFTSLALMAAVFKIPTPKDDISGKDVCKVYYKEKNLGRIKDYCQKDVMALMLVYARLRGDFKFKAEKIKLLS
jgi:predicted PolB exonuclease-like 3'-5' exonuclease